MKRAFLVLIVVFMSSASSFSQDSTIISDAKTIEARFEKLISQSNNYLKFKVVKKAGIK